MFTHICQAIIVLLLGLTSSAFAATYHVNQATGSNGNACSTDPAQARQSINAGIPCMAQGDTLIVHPGTYSECIMDHGTLGRPREPVGPVPPRFGPPRRSVATLLQPLPQCPQTDASIIEFGLPGTEYIVIDGFILDGSSITKASGISARPGIGTDEPVGPLRFQNMQIKHMRTGISTLGEQSEFTNIEVLNTGIPNDNGCEFPLGCSALYIRNRFNTFTNMYIHHATGRCIQFTSGGGFGVSQHTLQNSVLHDCQMAAITGGSIIKLYNNVIYNSNTGIDVYGSSEALYNTVYNITGLGFYLLGSNWTAQNNLIIDAGGGAIECADTAGNPQPCSGAGNVIDHNLCNATGNGCTMPGTAGQLWTSVTPGAAGFLRPKAGSPGLNVGLAMPQVPADADGNVRSDPPDLGAYELVTTPSVATALQFVAQPVSTTVDTVLPAVTVQIVDSGGTRVTSSTASVTLASTPNGGLLAGTLTRNALTGLATFDNIALEAVGTYTLQATSSGLTSATSTSFSITSPPPPPPTLGLGPPHTGGFFRR